MRGSLAVWCETDGVQFSGRTPLVELHFNIWCGLPNKSPDVLDIGFLLKEARTIKRILLYIPGKVSRSQLSDLSSALEDQTTLSAVFNEKMEVGNQLNDSFEAIKEGQVAFSVLRVNFTPNTDMTIESFIEDDGHIGTIVAFEEAVLRRMAGIGDHYIRIRLALSDGLEKMLVNQIVPSDRVFLSSFYRTQMIEFRVNEKRNFSKTLRERQKGGLPPTIPAIHYFLVRDLSAEMVQAHATFRKMRRLEPSLWDKYLDGLGSPDPENMIIYHWREIAAPNSTVEDFIGLAAFRQAGTNLWVYLFAIVLLGAIGSSLQSLLAILAAQLACPLPAQMLVLVALGAPLIGLTLYAYISAKRLPHRKVNKSKIDLGKNKPV